MAYAYRGIDYLKMKIVGIVNFWARKGLQKRPKK